MSSIGDANQIAGQRAHAGRRDRGLDHANGDRDGVARGRQDMCWTGVGGAARSGRTITLATAAREYVWLWDQRHGVSTKAIAERTGLSAKRVRFGVARARAHERKAAQDFSVRNPSWAVRQPRLVPLFPIGSYTPQSACPHHGPIRVGSVFCCMVCHGSGMDGHPFLQRDPLHDPKPDPKPNPSRRVARPLGETRRQRRRRLFGSRLQVAGSWSQATRSN
jgi:hypothetical protein